MRTGTTNRWGHKELRDLLYSKDLAKPMTELTFEEIQIREEEILNNIVNTGTTFVSNEFLDVCSSELNEILEGAERVSSTYKRGKIYDFDASIDGCYISYNAVLHLYLHDNPFHSNKY